MLSRSQYILISCVFLILAIIFANFSPLKNSIPNKKEGCIVNERKDTVVAKCLDSSENELWIHEIEEGDTLYYENLIEGFFVKGGKIRIIIYRKNGEGIGTIFIPIGGFKK